MRLATLHDTDGSTTLARIEEDGSRTRLPFRDLGHALESGPLSDLASLEGATVSDSARTAALLTPRKVLCVGLNYRKHIEETGEPTPEYPTIFSKFADALVAATDHIEVPVDRTQRVDWEAELVAVVGSELWNASVEDAAAAIAGFTVGNDVSMRDYQGRTSQWLQGKSFPRATPVGPLLLTADECGPRPDLQISCRVNGVSKQDSRTSDLLFGVPELLSYISQFIVLGPGDLVFTGTPGGVGQARPVPEFLHPGDVLETVIEGIGACRNRIVAV
ncbi:UNVERIFIED_CONTAM: fumarylacetoacetate hydrolase family protein [Microbacterium sp. SLM126]